MTVHVNDITSDTLEKMLVLKMKGINNYGDCLNRRR